MHEFWANRGSVGWVAHREIFDAELAPFATAVLDAADLTAGDRLLDVGCGTGDLVRQARQRGADPVGVDISELMIETARANVASAQFRVADAQTDALDGQDLFDVLVSRFGVMFFDDPAAAFSNLATATRPGGRLAFVCWRSGSENPMFRLGTHVLLDRMSDPPPGPVEGSPGPLGFADPDRIRASLSEPSAGSDGASAPLWTDVAIEPFDAWCDYSFDGSDGVENRLTMILGTGLGFEAKAQLLPQLGQAAWAELLDQVREELRDNLIDGRLQFNGATWLVTARRA